MIKAQFYCKKIHLWSLGINIQVGRDFITHPYHKGKIYYPVFAFILMFFYWNITLSVYNPPKIMLNRAQRRANKMQ